METELLSEAYQRLHGAGPEWGENTLTNHGPMAVEVLVRRGHVGEVHGWLDRYIGRLDDLPASTEAVGDRNWRQALGDERRIGDWTAYLTRQVTERPWRDVLATWWPRLLPGIVAGTTHGVIRVGHAVRTLLTGDTSRPVLVELAHGLAFWAARFRAVPGAQSPAGRLPANAVLAMLPRLDRQAGTVAERLARLPEVPGWTSTVAALRAPSDPDDARAILSDLTTAATLRYATHGHANPVLLVHTATAPNAVLHVLPALPRELWSASLAAAWSATAAVLSAYAPGTATPDRLPVVTGDDADVLARAVAHGDEHVIKFADTAVDVYHRTGDRAALVAAVRAAELIG
ncbi:questin oxidase family protein [Plantactinospora endophytica]|uniref:DUF4243 domain-containing protein n=1 Tax=Plantactinospora endophytica TaxID=673535 RepID=A0ABQ4EF84_9ACTN|nr:questin oxidase family protein [Plantactinospora endophytica]GIG93388.1 hypothetical protein Pen02_83240 [Plantactinospora endophytica]